MRVLKVWIQVLVNSKPQSSMLHCPIRHLRAVAGAVGTAVRDLGQQLVAGAIKLNASEGPILELRAGLLRAVELQDATLVMVMEDLNGHETSHWSRRKGPVWCSVG
jgi:hypothetical protein